MADDSLTEFRQILGDYEISLFRDPVIDPETKETMTNGKKSPMWRRTRARESPSPARPNGRRGFEFCDGADRDRTGDLLLAKPKRLALAGDPPNRINNLAPRHRPVAPSGEPAVAQLVAQLRPP